MTLAIQGVALTQYLLQATPDLGSPTWLTINTNTTDVNGLSTFRDLAATNYPARFYRAVMP